ncbi:MAG: nucleotidyltransferase family protein [Planctomycetota bacterium]
MTRRRLDRALCTALGRWPVAAPAARRLAEAPDAAILGALRFARAEGTEPLAIAVLQETIWERLPAALREQCEAHRREAAAYTGLVVRTLHETLDRFDAAGLHAAVFKGPVMAQRLFGHRGRRPGGDIDLLLPSEQIEPAVQLLTADGRYAPRPPFDQADVRAVARAVTVDPVNAADQHPEFDLHRSFAHRWICDLPAGAVWEQTVEVELAGRTVRSVSDPLGALQATLHLAAGGYAWRQAVDLAGWDRVLAPADRAVLQRLARAAGCEGIALHGFELVRAVFGDPAPPGGDPPPPGGDPPPPGGDPPPPGGDPAPHAPAPMPSPSPTARARAALLTDLGAVPAALFVASPLRTGYVRSLVRGLAADRRADALAAMARAVITPNPIDRGRPGAVWRRPFQVAARLVAALGRTA